MLDFTRSYPKNVANTNAEESHTEGDRIANDVKTFGIRCVDCTNHIK